MRDVSRAGHELGRARLDGLPARISLRALLEQRMRREAEAYNADPGPVFRGLVQPADSIRHSDGFRLRQPRPLDADRLMTAVEEAVAAGLLAFRVGATEQTDLAAEVDVDAHDEVVAVLERPVVAREP
jgi:hypothetical protein